MKKLLVVESPSKIKTIKKFLGPEFKIMSTMGHVKDLPVSEMGVSRDPIAISYVPVKDKAKVIADLCKAAQGVDEVYLAPDPDREGEIIAWHVAEEMKKVMKNPEAIHRITFNEITKPAILAGIKNQHSIDMNKVAAQQSRRVLDRWVGYEVSPLLWKKIKKGLSAGRVQSVALKFICEREEAIRSFTPEEYWSITGTFKHAKGQLVAPLTHIGTKKAEIKTQKTADKITEEVKKADFKITEINDKKRSKNPLPPFMTSTIQQAAYNRLGFSVKKTMQIAQNLYEGIPLGGDGTPVALITYMRTDSLRLSDTAINSARDFISKNFGEKYLPGKPQVYGKKSKTASQDAHEAIRPVDMVVSATHVHKHATKDQARLYELIWQRTLASQMSSAEYAQRQMVLKGDKYIFKVTGSTLLFDGFLKVYGIDEEDEKEKNTKIPEGINQNDPVDVKKVDPKQHFTQPPPRFSEATLVKEMEKEGIGRPSTYSAVMNTIRARDYTTLENKRFVPTELGMTVVTVLKGGFAHIMDTQFTANMEADLDKISEGDLERDTLLTKFWKNFEPDLKAFKGDTTRQAQETVVDCPECKEKKLLIRFGKAGEFLGCSGYPECPFTSNFERNPDTNEIKLVAKAEPKKLDVDCPKCGKHMREMVGRFGPFIACSGYPTCKHIHQNIAGFKCPKDEGDVAERKWRGGSFWGCKNYPKCKFALFGDIEETPCPKCKAPALIKKVSKAGKVTLLCGDKKCGYTK
jgi:DNA topoisomerase-1